MNLDMLTGRERDALTDKLASAATKFFRVAHSLGRTALDNFPAGDNRDYLFTVRQRYVDAMDEAHGLLEGAWKGAL